MRAFFLTSTARWNEMQRLFNIDKWFVLEAGKALNFENPLARRVRLDVNAPGSAQLFYVTGNGEVTFLANVSGRDVVEFASHGGDFAIQCEGNDVWLYTIDGEDTSFANPGAVVFTKIVERRARNPELELMQHMMKRNLDMRMEAQRSELEQLWARREAAAASRAAQSAAASAPASAASESQPDGDADAGSGGEPAAGGDRSSANKKG